MNNIEIMNYTKKLTIEKNELEKRLKIINRELCELEDSCSHLFVDLGCSFDWGNKCYCLFCSKTKILNDVELYYSCLVHAEKYLDFLDVYIDLDRTQKLEKIQVIAMGIIRQNPKIERNELISELNKTISINTSENTQHVLCK